MTTPEQPHEGDLNQPQQPQQPVVPPQPAAPQQLQQLSREQLEAQYNQQQAPQQPQMPQAPQQQQQPGYQAPQQPSPAPQAPQYGAPQPQGQQPFAQPNQYGQQPHYAQPGQYQQAQYQQPVAYGEPGPGEPFNGATSPDDLTRPLYGATFGQSIRRFFKNYVNFKGRASRSEYWWVQLFLTLVFLLPTAVYFIGLLMTIGAAASTTYYDEVTGTFVESGSAATYGPGLAVLIISGVLMLVMGLATILPSLGLAWRRLHDANFAGPFYLLTLTSIGSIVVLVFTILGPKPEGRRFDQR